MLFGNIYFAFVKFMLTFKTIPLAALSYIERSENSLSLAKLIDIAYVLEVEPWQFFVNENYNVGFEFVEPIEKALISNFRKIPTREKKRIVFDVVEGLST